jgi:glutamyl-tRNA synthetase/glutamyl-Q tRNA(Asp) synthetase
MVSEFCILHSALTQSPTTRFAPSPTGYLHLGHVVHALHVWDTARALDGRVLLRIEDHDRLRSRPEYERGILEDLAWLGFQPDIGPVRQSDEPDVYEEALRRLADRHRVYACDCSRRAIAAAQTGSVPMDGRELPYPGSCRDRRLAFGPGLGVRVETAPGIEQFDDARLGVIEQDPAAQCGDVLLRDRDGFWTYQFAVTVDDHRQGVDLVIRGQDLLPSTGRQIRLARMLGRERPPVFAHHLLVVNPLGEKLSKSAGTEGVRELREAGLTADEVLERARVALEETSR